MRIDFDAYKDGRSEARYEDEGEHSTSEVKDAAYVCMVDESAGQRERRYEDAS